MTVTIPGGGMVRGPRAKGLSRRRFAPEDIPWDGGAKATSGKVRSYVALAVPLGGEKPPRSRLKKNATASAAERTPSFP